MSSVRCGSRSSTRWRTTSASTTRGSTSSAGPEHYDPHVPFSRKLLNEGEDIVLDLHPHWVYFVKTGLVFLAAVVVGVLLLTWDDAPDALGIPSGVLIL